MKISQIQLSLLTGKFKNSKMEQNDDTKELDQDGSELQSYQNEGGS